MERRARLGYVVKYFPRLSETFIAQEILELEGQGAEVHVLALVENDAPAGHAWLRALRAPVTVCAALRASDGWKALRDRLGGPGRVRAGAHRALALAIEHPSGKGWRHLRQAVAIARIAADRGLEHLHAHFANRPAFTALLAHLLSGIPFSFTAHAKDIYAKGPPPDVLRRQARHAAFVATVTAANRRHLEPLLGPRLAARMRLLYNGVDLEAIRPRAAGAAPAGPDVLCVARLVDKKGVDVLIEALALLRDAGREVSCAIAGDGPCLEGLRGRAAGRGLDRVRFLGALPHERVVDLLREARLCVLPCRVSVDGDRDALPTVLLEAMAAGLACVSTPIGGVPEIIVPGETGLLVPPEDAAGLAAAIRRILEDGDRARRMGEAGRRRAERLFDRRRNVSTLHGWFLESIGRTDREGAGLLAAGRRA
jgi:glycosyltransferase involved in cell wall biosynthesis